MMSHYRNGKVTKIQTIMGKRPMCPESVTRMSDQTIKLTAES